MKKKGSTIVIVVMVMSLTFFIASLMIKLSIKNQSISNSKTNNIKAYYCSNTGISDMIYYIIKNNYKITNNVNISNQYSNNKLLFNNSNYSYEATLQPLKTSNINELYVSKLNTIGNTVFFKFIVKSIGTYLNTQCTITASITVSTTKLSSSDTYIYQSHTINQKIIYPVASMDS